MPMDWRLSTFAVRVRLYVDVMSGPEPSLQFYLQNSGSEQNQDSWKCELAPVDRLTNETSRAKLL